jgi:hypothetical protein
MDNPKTETGIMRAIMLALSERGHFVARGNVGLFFTKTGEPVRTGLPVGFSDLFGHRGGDAVAWYIEVKKPGGRIRKEQQQFIDAMLSRGAIAGIARSVDEAIAIVEHGFSAAQTPR